jgi:hypothetical protein
LALDGSIWRDILVWAIIAVTVIPGVAWIEWRCFTWGREVFAQTPGPTLKLRRFVAMLKVWLGVVPFGILGAMRLLVKADQKGGFEGGDGLLLCLSWFAALVIGLVGPAFALGVQWAYAAKMRDSSLDEFEEIA